MYPLNCMGRMLASTPTNRTALGYYSVCPLTNPFQSR